MISLSHSWRGYRLGRSTSDQCVRRLEAPGGHPDSTGQVHHLRMTSSPDCQRRRAQWIRAQHRAHDRRRSEERHGSEHPPSAAAHSARWPAGVWRFGVSSAVFSSWVCSCIDQKLEKKNRSVHEPIPPPSNHLSPSLSPPDLSPCRSPRAGGSRPVLSGNGAS